MRSVFVNETDLSRSDAWRVKEIKFLAPHMPSLSTYMGIIWYKKSGGDGGGFSVHITHKEKY